MIFQKGGHTVIVGHTLRGAQTPNGTCRKSLLLFEVNYMESTADFDTTCGLLVSPCLHCQADKVILFKAMSSKQTGSMKSTQSTAQQKNVRPFKNQNINTLDRTQGKQLGVVRASLSQRGTFGLSPCRVLLPYQLRPRDLLSHVFHRRHQLCLPLFTPLAQRADIHTYSI